MESTKDTLTPSSSIIWSRQPASEWALGYPIGNGRIGAMVLGHPLRERVGLNHDLLWRRFWTYQDRETAGDMGEIRRLCLEGSWDDAHSLILKKIPVSGRALYVNPFVPAGDLGIFPLHGKLETEDEIEDYQRHLNMDTGIAEVSYTTGGVRFRRECLCSWPAGVLVIHLSSGTAGRLSGEVTLSRLLDPDCQVTGTSRLGEVILRGEFEEGGRFALVVRVVQWGGRLTGGRTTYQPPGGDMPPKDLAGLQFIFRSNEEPWNPHGVSTCFDSSDRVLLLVALSTGDSGEDPAECCRKKLQAVTADYPALRREHIRDHQRLFGRVNLSLSAPRGHASAAPDSGADDATDRRNPRLRPSASPESSDSGAAEATDTAGIGAGSGSPSPSPIPTDELVSRVCSDSEVTGAGFRLLIEQLFKLGRYLAISSGRPSGPGGPSKAPITLQGIWNQDRRPAWDSDYHLDLNLEMCYWPLELANLSELMEPLMDWVELLLPQGRHAAMDLYGCRGVALPTVGDHMNVGNLDDLCFWWTGAAAWVAQILWQHWEYGGDASFLRERLYPFLKELAVFYQDYLIEDKSGRLVPVPSCSPEMGIGGRERYSSLSSPSTMDLELIRDTFTHLLDASRLLGLDEDERRSWEDVLRRVPLPAIHKDGYLQEWLEDHEPEDPGHRHRSHLVGICPGERITWEDTPEYAEAARKALEKRLAHGRARSLSLTTVWDAQIFARLYDSEGVLEQLRHTVKTNAMDNLLMALCDWRGLGAGINWFPGTKLFQIEASIGITASIAEMLLQDRRGLLRLLPALPKEWAEGRVTGLRARGFEIDIEWKQTRLERATIKSLRGGVCRVKSFGTSGPPMVSCGGGKEVYSNVRSQDITEFLTDPGDTYTLTYLQRGK